MTGTLSDAAMAWSWCDLSLPYRGQLRPAARHVVLGRLRGLLGMHLKARLPQSDFACLFPEQGTDPPPFVSRLDGALRAPVLKVRLIGAAERWAVPVARALEVIGREGVLVPGQRAPLTGCRGVTPTAGALAEVGAVGVGRLVLETPLALACTSMDGNTLWATLRRRAQALAVWQPRPLMFPDGAPPMMTMTKVRPVTWRRTAHRQARVVPMQGWTGFIDLSGETGAWAPLLRVAEAFHAGRHSTFGLGRVRLSAGTDEEDACT